MNTNLVAQVTEQVVAYICENLADSLVSAVKEAMEGGQDTDEVATVIRDTLAKVYGSIPKTAAPVATAVAATPAVSAARPASSSSSGSRGSADKLKDANGNTIKCCAITKKDKTPCKHDAKAKVMENGKEVYYCLVHAKSGAAAPADPNARPGAAAKAPAKNTNSSFMGLVSSAASSSAAPASFGLDATDINID